MSNKILNSYIKEAKALIQRTEGSYAASVLADFEEALRKSSNKMQTAYKWLQDYKHGKRINPNQPKPVTVAPKAPVQTEAVKLETVTKGYANKFARMWEYSNILTKPYYDKATPRQIATLIKRKLETIEKMETHVDIQTYEHFRMALTESLRTEREQEIRNEVIYTLAGHFQWSEIEWTFWLHEKRRSEDHYILIAAEAWCKTKYRDAKSLHKAVANATRQLLVEAIR